MIRIVPYDVSWPAQFEIEAANIRGALGSRALRVEHVGSIAIPGLDAKPVSDTQVAVATLATLSPFSAVLAGLGMLLSNRHSGSGSRRARSDWKQLRS